MARVGFLIFGVLLMLVSSSKARSPLPRDGDCNRYVREVSLKGETVWQFTRADAPEYKLGNFLTANWLANGNTLITGWVPGDDDTSHWPGTSQVIEVTPAKTLSGLWRHGRTLIQVRPRVFSFLMNPESQRTLNQEGKLPTPAARSRPADWKL